MSVQVRTGIGSLVFSTLAIVLYGGVYSVGAKVEEDAKQAEDAKNDKNKIPNSEPLSDVWF